MQQNYQSYQPLGAQNALNQQQQQYQYYQRICAHQALIRQPYQSNQLVYTQQAFNQQQQLYQYNQPLCTQQTFHQQQFDEGPKIYNPRLGFIKKVYGIISCQLLLTTLSILLFQGLLDKKYFYSRYNIPQSLLTLMYISVALALICSAVIGGFQVPINYILLGTFTLAESYFVGFCTAPVDPVFVLLAAFLTLSITLALTVYAWTTKEDFTVYRASMCIAGWSALASSVLFLLRATDILPYPPVVILSSIASVIVYSAYLILDTQMLMGGHRYQLGLDDYVVASFHIYMDILILFFRIMRVLSAFKKKK